MKQISCAHLGVVRRSTSGSTLVMALMSTTQSQCETYVTLTDETYILNDFPSLMERDGISGAYFNQSSTLFMIV